MRLEGAGGIDELGCKVGEFAGGQRGQEIECKPKKAQKGRQHGDFGESCPILVGPQMDDAGETL